MGKEQCEVTPQSTASQSWHFRVKELQTSEKRILRKLPEFKDKQWVLYPDDFFMDLWGVLISLLMLYTATIMPYRVALIDSDSSQWANWEYALDVCFGLDVCINSVLAYYDEEMSLVVSRRRIFLHYLTSWMLPDMASSLPFDLILSTQSYNNFIRLAKLPRVYKLIKLAKLLRIAKVVKNRSRFVHYANSVLRVSLSVERLFWFLVWLILLLHLFACCWVFFARLDEDQPDNWIQCKGYLDYSNAQLYIVAVYFSIMTLATVGYGDITPCNTTERVVCCAMMLVGIFVYSVTIGSLTNLLGSLDKRRAVLNQRIELLVELSEKYHFNKLFFQKLSQAVEYEQRNSQKELNDLFTCLPSTLRTQLLIVIYCQMLEANVFFSERTEHFVAWVAPRLSPVRIMEDEFVYRESEPAAEMYFVAKGEVEYVLVYDVKQEPYHVVKTNYYFGEEDLLLSETRLHQFTTKTAATSEFLVLSRDNFEAMMSTFESEALEVVAMTERRKERIIEHKSLAEEHIRAKTLVIRHETTPAGKAEIHSAVTELIKGQEIDNLSDVSSEDEINDRKETAFSGALPSADVLLSLESVKMDRKATKAAVLLTKHKGKTKGKSDLRELHQKVSRMEAKFDALAELVMRIGEQLGTGPLYPSSAASQHSEGPLDAIAEAGVDTEEKDKEPNE